MDPRSDSSKQLHFPYFQKDNVPDQRTPVQQHEDDIGKTLNVDKVDKLETLICLESLLAVCYQTLAWLVHNQTIRHECQQFEQHAQHHQEELKKIFPLSPKSEAAIESKVNHHLLHLKPPYLSLRELINLAINLTVLKMDIYKYLSHTVPEHHDVLNNLLQDNAEEMYFLRQERNFHRNRLDTFFKVQ